MTTILGIRRVLFAAPLLAAVTAVAVASMHVESAQGPAPVAAEIDGDLAVAAGNKTYYSNALHLTIVGQFGYDCCNNPVAWGKKSQYVVSGGCFICFPPPH